MITSAALAAMSLDELQHFADQVGVGYVGLTREDLVNKLALEGILIKSMAHLGL